MTYKNQGNRMSELPGTCPLHPGFRPENGTGANHPAATCHAQVCPSCGEVVQPNQIVDQRHSFCPKGAGENVRSCGEQLIW